MCCRDRKIPAAIVGTLACFTLFLSFTMFIFAVRFNNDGLSSGVSQEATDYQNDAFFFLAGAAGLAFMCSVCGLCTCCCKKRCCTQVLGCTLLPIAILICVFGMTLTSVSHTSNEDLQSFCDVDITNFEDMTERDKGAQMLRESIQKIDTEMGAFVSSRMCSNICPCDLNFREDEAE